MDPKQYCDNKVLVPGSTFYYAIKKIEYRHRDAIIAIQAFYQELEEIIYHFSDVGVAQARLNWWREEIFKMQYATPSHPVVLCLQKNKIVSEELLNLIDGFEQHFSYLNFKKAEDVIEHLKQTAGVKEVLFANVIFDGKVEDSNAVFQAMFIIEMTYYIQHLHYFMQRDIVYFSDEELLQFNLKRSDLLSRKTTENIRALLRFKVQEILTACEQLKPVYPMLQARVNISKATLKVIKSGDFAVLENLIDITPIKRWWTSLSS